MAMYVKAIGVCLSYLWADLRALLWRAHWRCVIGLEEFRRLRILPTYSSTKARLLSCCVVPVGNGVAAVAAEQ